MSQVPIDISCDSRCHARTHTPVYTRNIYNIYDTVMQYKIKIEFYKTFNYYLVRNSTTNSEPIPNYGDGPIAWTATKVLVRRGSSC